MRGPNPQGVSIAAVGDLHCGRESAGELRRLFAKMAESADVLALCGDLTDYGLPEEARVLAEELRSAAKGPVLAVLGNHDYEADKADEVKKVLGGAGVHVLDGDSFEAFGVGFAGVRGYMGGFGSRALQAWGEPATKIFVREAVEEALKLESALARIRAARRVVLLHYSPIAATVQGEPEELLPFLGSSRLEEPLNRYPVKAVFHGHAHHGSPEGRLASGAPVYNVAMPVLKRASHGELFRVVRLPKED